VDKDKKAAIRDPVFAVIEAHRVAWVVEMATMDRADPVAAKNEGRTVTAVDVEAKKRAKRAVDDAMEALKKTLYFMPRHVLEMGQPLRKRHLARFDQTGTQQGFERETGEVRARGAFGRPIRFAGVA
jgi:hypothetical protein